MIRFTLEDIDRAIYNKLRIGLVDLGLLPDVAAYTGDVAGYNAAKSALPNVVEIFGVGSGLSRNEMNISHVTVNRVNMSQGSLGAGPVTNFVEYENGTGDTRFKKVKHLAATKNLQYEVRLFTDSTYIERVVSSLILDSLSTVAYIHTYDDIDVVSENCFFLKNDGDVNMSTPEWMEWQYRYTAQDIWIGSETIIRDDIVPMTSVVPVLEVLPYGEGLPDNVDIQPDMTNLVVWLKPSSFTAPSWDDVSGNGNHFTQAAPSLQASVNPTGINGKPSVTYDGTSYYQLLSKALAVDSATIHLTLKADDLGSTYRTPFILSASTYTTPGTQFMQLNTIGARYNLNTATGGLSSNNIAPLDGTPKIITFIKTPISLEVLLNGVSVVYLTGIQNVGSTSHFIGAWGGRFYIGEVGDILIYDIAQQGTALSNTFDYIKSEYII